MPSEATQKSSPVPSESQGASSNQSQSKPGPSLFKTSSLTPQQWHRSEEVTRSLLEDVNSNTSLSQQDDFSSYIYIKGPQSNVAVQSPSTNSQKLPHTKASGIESSFNSTPLKSTQSSQRTSSAPDTQSLQDVDTSDPIHKPQRPRELSHTSPQVRTTQKITPSRSESLATTNQSLLGLHIVKLTWNSSKFKKEWIGDIIHKVLPGCKFQIRNWRPLEKLVFVKFLSFGG